MLPAASLETTGTTELASSPDGYCPQPGSVAVRPRNVG